MSDLRFNKLKPNSPISVFTWWGEKKKKWRGGCVDTALHSNQLILLKSNSEWLIRRDKRMKDALSLLFSGRRVGGKLMSPAMCASHAAIAEPSALLVILRRRRLRPHAM